MGSISVMHGALAGRRDGTVSGDFDGGTGRYGQILRPDGKGGFLDGTGRYSTTEESFSAGRDDTSQR